MPNAPLPPGPVRPVPRAAGALVPGVRRIAVLRANSIGDFVFVLPALEALAAAYPDSEVTYLGRPWHPDLLDTRPGPWHRVEVVPPYPGIADDPELPRDSAQLRRFFAQQQRRRYDLALQLHGGGGNTNPFLRRLGARVTAGLRAAGAPHLDRTLPYVYHQHEVLRYLETVALVGAGPVTLEPRLAVTPADEAEAAAALAGTAGPYVALHPGATDPRRRWPPGSFARAADALTDLGVQVVLVGAGDDDADAAGRIAALTRRAPVDLVNRLSLGGTVGVLAACALVIANDSGPRHLAAAVGTRTVTIYWGGNVINAGPLFVGRHRLAASFRTSCPTCGADQSGSRCPHDPSFVAEVAVEEVLRLAVDLLGEAGAGRDATAADG